MGSIISFPGASKIDPVRTGLFSEQINGQTSRAGMKAAPMRKIDGLSQQYYKLSSATPHVYDARSSYDYTAALPMHAKSLPTAFDFTLKTVDLERRSLHVFIDERTDNHIRASGGFELEQPALKRLAGITLDVHNTLVGSLYTTAGNFGAGNADPGNFNTATTDLVGPVTTAIRAIIGSIHETPTHAVCDIAVAHALLKLDQVRQRPGSDSGNVAGGAMATETQLGAFFRDMFGLELIIDRSRTISAAGAASAPFGAVLAIVRLADDGTPTFAHTVVQDWNVDETTLAGVYTEEVRDPMGRKLIADCAYKAMVEDSGAGYLLTGTLS